MKFSSLLAGVLGAAFLSCSAGPVRAAGDDAASLLAKHKAYVGWEFQDGTFSTMRLKGDETDAKGQVRLRFTELRIGLINRTTLVDLRRGGITEDSGFTGNIFWQSNENGFTTPMFGDGAKLALAEDIVMNEATTRLPGTLKTPATVDGKSVDVVRITPPQGFPIDLYVDPETGAYAQAVIDPDGSQTETIHILAYAPVGTSAKRAIGSYRYDQSTNTWNVRSVEANPPLTGDDLHPPAPRATWSFSNPKPFPMKVTDKRFIVDAKINGVPGRFIVDTGASGIYLSRAFGARAHAKPFTTSEAYGIGGGTKDEVDTLDTVDVGGNVLSNVIAYSGGESFDEDAPDGLIGFDLFGGAVVNLDSAASTMTISDPATAAVEPAGGVPMNVDLTDGTPSVPMKMDGRIDVNATLDSGNFYYVLFGTDLITKHGLSIMVDNTDVGYLQSHVAIGGVGGYEAERCGHVESLVIGPIVYQQPPACESRSFSGSDVLVGFDFLRHFNFIFDYPHGHLIMIPHREQ